MDTVSEPPLSGPLARTAFGRQVRDALRNLSDTPYLRRHPLSRALVEGPAADRTLEELLHEAIERLQPASGSGPAAERAERRHRLFTLHYVEGLERGNVEQALGCGQSEYYRLHQDGIEAVARFLRDRIFGRETARTRWPREARAAAAGHERSGRTRLAGRDGLLAELKGLYARMVVAGRGRIVFIGGEPGVGKTRLAEELGWYVEETGGRFLRAGYLRDGTAPYGVCVDLLRAGLKGLPPQEIAALTGPYAAELGRLLPELAAGPSIEPPLRRRMPEEEQYRLFDAMARVLGGLAARAPLLLLVDDLQWAPGMNTVSQVARRLAGHPVLMAGTYRDVEFHAQQGHMQRRQDLVRAGIAEVITLEPLNPEDSAGMVASILDGAAAKELAGGIYGSTHGNPLFIEEVLRSLVQKGSVRQGADGWQVIDASHSELPATLAQVVNERVAGLGPGAAAAFARAAVLGTEFSFAVLQELTGIPEDDLVDLLERATEVRLLVDRWTPREERLAFADDQFQEVLYQGIAPPRRRRLHVQAGRAMESVYAETLDAHAAELARHLSSSTDPSELARALHYAETAAQQAEAAYSYELGTRAWERALAIHEAVDTDGFEKRCDLLLALGRAQLKGLALPAKVENTALLAVNLAETLEDSKRASSACQIALSTWTVDGGMAAFGHEKWRQWVARADRHAAPETVDRAHADLALAAVHESAGRFAEDRGATQRAIDLARRLDDDEAFLLAAARLLRRSAPQYWDQTLSLAEEVMSRPRKSVSLGTLCWALRTCSMVFVAHGCRAAAEEAFRQICDEAARTRDPKFLLDAQYTQALLTFLNGDLEGAVQAGARLLSLAEQLERPGWGARFAANLNFRPLLYLGRVEEALTALSQSSQIVGVPEPLSDTIRRTVGLAYAGQLVEASTLLHDILAKHEMHSDEDETYTGALTELLEAAILTQDAEAATLLARRLASLSGAASAGGWIFTAVGRHVGAAAAQLGDFRAAQAHYQQALDACEKLRCRPEVALVHLDLAGLLLGQSYQEAAVRPRQTFPLAPMEENTARANGLRHLRFAIEELEAMDMRPALQQALNLSARTEV